MSDPPTPSNELPGSGVRRSAKASIITIACILVLFGAGATALFWPQFHQPSQSALTQQVDATVVDRELIPSTGTSGRDYDIRYHYTVDGTTFEATARSIDGELSGDSIEVCIDPAKPERNAPMIDGAHCGDPSLGKWTSTATRLD